MSATLSAQVQLKQVQQLVYKGKLSSAKEIIEYKLSESISITDKIELFKLKGDIYKIEGNLDLAYKSWVKSNSLRKKHYSESDCHLAWNYALLSNYYYEKINTDLALLYADSCNFLIKNLTLSQQIDIEVYKIWNILGQSYKQRKNNLSKIEILEKYKLSQLYYNKSIDFILKNKIEKRELAITYRHLGNSFLDLTFLVKDDKIKYLHYYNQASKYYNFSKNIWIELYNKQHYELGRTQFVHGLLNYYTKDSIVNKSIDLTINFMEKSIENYNLKSDIDFKDIPNKEDLLMACSYLTKAYFRKLKKTQNVDWLRKAKRINLLAIEIWNEIHESFTAKRINQNLALYSLIPFEQSIAIEIFRKEMNLEFSIEKIFLANQKLKYFDLYKSKMTTEKFISIIELQNKLKPNEIFLDYHISTAIGQLVIVKISKKDYELIITPYPSLNELERLNESIAKFDFDEYTKVAHTIYQKIIEPCTNMDQDIILCLDGFLNKIPFEALLVSKKNLEIKDYRKLDYLINHTNIQYTLSSNLFRTKQASILPFEIHAFSPQKAEYSELPFSQKLIQQLEKKHSAKTFQNYDATMTNFLNSDGPILHLSGHGEIDIEQSWKSRLIFSESTLSIDEIKFVNDVPKLVVLNTCNSSLGRIYQGDGVNGFVRAFHEAGVETTISNLWEVDDKISNRLLLTFYDNLNAGFSTSYALIHAKKDIIYNSESSKTAAPYYWAGHRLVGKDISFQTKISTNDNSIKGYIIFCISLIALIIIIGFRKLKKTIHRKPKN